MRFDYIYALIVLADLVAVSFRDGTNTPLAEYIFKPALMLSLGYYFAQHSVSGKKRNFVLSALAFSWLGDVFLLFKDFFVLGLVSFLIAHIFYILAFSIDYSVKNIFRPYRILPKIIMLAYGMGLFVYLFPHLPTALKIPVAAYTITILLMLLAALNRVGVVNKLSGQMVLLGAMQFVMSDSMIALSRFVQPFPLSGMAIMLTYAIGQYFIVKGLLISPNSSNV
jgi:uncharacterized membrane protein YhhN